MAKSPEYFARVIFVIVRVDDKSNRIVGNSFQRVLNFIGQRRILVVYDHNPIFADRCADVSASALQHLDASGNFGYFDLDFAEIMVLRNRKPTEQCRYG